MHNGYEDVFKVEYLDPHNLCLKIARQNGRASSQIKGKPYNFEAYFV